MVDAHPSAIRPQGEAPSLAEAEILRQLRSLTFGALEVHVHDARIVQIERREKIRFDDQRHRR